MIRGSLFTRFFLQDGIRQTPAYRDLASGSTEAFAAAVRSRWAELEQMQRPSEAETESEFIYPIIGALGWQHLPQQEPGRGLRDIADALLFVDDQSKAKARAERASADRFRFGAMVVENEARDTALDRASGNAETPSTQIIRYLGRAESQSGGALRWGLLINGRFWQLYWAHARARAEGFVELDLPGLLSPLAPPIPDDAPEDHWLRVFLLLFGRDALRPADASGHSFLDFALDEGRHYEQRITATLSRVVFDQVFPGLIAAIARELPHAALAEVREASLRLLYRLLFLLYAENRTSCPCTMQATPTTACAASVRTRRDIVDDRRALSPSARTWWPRLAALFATVAEGDPSMGLPPYNGGLFEHKDDLLARAITHLSCFDRGRRCRCLGGSPSA